MWSLYTGQQPYVCTAGRLLPNKRFPHFLNTCHPQYIALARRCLQADPHDRPTFADISACLHELFGQLDAPSSGGSVREGQGREELASLCGSRSKLGSSLQVHLETLRASGVVTPVMTVFSGLWSARGRAACPAYKTK